MLRSVIDTSVVVAAVQSKNGPANAIMRLVAHRQLRMLASPPLFLEYEDVLKRPEHRLVHGLSIPQIDDFIAELAALIQPVEIHFQWRPQLRDPADEMVLEAAQNGGADAILTYNVADFAAAAALFSIPVITPPEFLKKGSHE